MQRSNQKLHEKIDVTRLPSLPHVLLRLLEACHQDDASLAALTAIIDKDPALGAKVVTIANSPALGPPKRVGNIRRALVVLGLGTVRTIAVTSAVQQFFSKFNYEDLAFLKAFWRQSLLCALAARETARLISYPAPDEAYIAGLLHDIGRLALASTVPEDYARVHGAARNDHELIALEKERFGLAHNEIGAELIGRWALGSFIADAVLYHHEPVERLVDAHHLVKLLNLAAALSEGRSYPSADALLTADALFGLTHGMTTRLFSRCLEELADIARYMDIDIDPTATPGDADETRDAVRDQVKQAQLGREVRDMALTYAATAALGTEASTDAVLAAIAQATVALFGERTSCVLLYDAGDNTLRGQPVSPESHLISELAVPVAQGRSLTADALLTGTAVDTFAAAKVRSQSVLDAQIVRLLGRQGMLCLPMITAGRWVGTLVLGVDQDELARMWPYRKLMSLFASQVAHALAAIRTRDQESGDSREQLHRTYQARAREIVHEASNPLAIIRNYLEGLAIKLGHEHPAQDEIRVMREEIERVTRIIRTLSETSEKEAGPNGPVNINDLVRDTLRLFADTALIGANIDVRLDLDAALPMLVTGPDAIKQILTNLTKNALESMAQGGVLRVATRDRVIFEGNEYVELTVSDNGPGIPPQFLSRLFQPVTPAEGSDHAGLGLSIVKNLVTGLKGYVTCRSRPDVGTSFQILLPRVLAE